MRWALEGAVRARRVSQFGGCTHLRPSVDLVSSRGAWRGHGPVLCLVLLLGAGFAVPEVRAVPADHSRELSLRQPDGRTFPARLYGDEWAHWYETADGLTVVQRADGAWTYAARAASGGLVPSVALVGAVPAPAEVPRHLRPSADRLRAAYERRAAAPRSGVTLASITGTAKVAVILVQFTDTPAGEGATGPHTPSYFADATNGILFGTAEGKMRDYYREASYGQLTVTGAVAASAWVTSAHTEGYYGNDCAESACPGATTDNCAACISELAREAVRIADAAGFDFAPYDTDGDGVIDHVLVIHAGHDQAAAGQTADIWSHRWEIAGGESVDGKVVRGYTMLAEDDSMNVFAHEFGHDLGAPDLYDYGYDSEPVGRWCNMASNVWSSRPPHFCGLLTYDLDARFQNSIVGWAAATQLTTSRALSVGQLDQNQSGSVYVTSPAFSGGEYFVVENRERTGFYDSSVPEEGILFTHADMDMPDHGAGFNDGPPNSAYGAWVERPGNVYSADGAAYSAEDGETQFTAATVPSTAANDGRTSHVSFTAAGAEGAVMSASFTFDTGGTGEGMSPPFALYLGPGFGPPGGSGTGEAMSAAFALYLGPGFGPPGGSGTGEAMSAAFALYLGPLSEGYAMSPPFALDTGVGAVPTTPAAGDFWLTGEPTTITVAWTPTGTLVHHLTIRLSDDGVAWPDSLILARNVLASSHAWVATDTTIFRRDAVHARIRLERFSDTGAPLGYTESAEFALGNNASVRLDVQRNNTSWLPTPVLSWRADPSAEHYDITVASDPSTACSQSTWMTEVTAPLTWTQIPASQWDTWPAAFYTATVQPVWAYNQRGLPYVATTFQRVKLADLDPHNWPVSPSKPPVLLVHGWTSDQSTWYACDQSPLVDALNSGTDGTAFHTWSFEYPNIGSIRHAAAGLREACSYLRCLYNPVNPNAPTTHISLVAHSMGGLVSRAYLQGLAVDPRDDPNSGALLSRPITGETSHLATLSSPLFGEPPKAVEGAAIVNGAFSRGGLSVGDLDETGAFISQLNDPDHTTLPGIRYLFTAGTDAWTYGGGLGFVTDRYLSQVCERNDGVVDQGSARGDCPRKRPYDREAHRELPPLVLPPLEGGSIVRSQYFLSHGRISRPGVISRTPASFSCSRPSALR